MNRNSFGFLSAAALLIAFVLSGFMVSPAYADEPAPPPDSAAVGEESSAEESVITEPPLDEEPSAEGEEVL